MGHSDGKDAAPWEPGPRRLEADLRGFLRRHAPPGDLRTAQVAVESAFRSVISEANRDLAGLLRDVRDWRAALRARRPAGHSADVLLMRAIRCAVRQYRLQVELGALALRDGLTGLCNRRGFLLLAERQVRLGRRAGRPMLLFFVDVDGLKAINDGFGHPEGDLALVRTADALVRTFRDSDLLARLGGDEFAALAIEAAGSGAEAIAGRLDRCLEAVASGERRYRLSVSWGVARFDPLSRLTIGQLMVLADQDMYRRKAPHPRSRDHAARPEGAAPDRTGHDAGQPDRPARPEGTRPGAVPPEGTAPGAVPPEGAGEPAGPGMT